MVRWGVIGAGSIADTKVMPAIKNVPDAELVHVMARDDARAAQMAAKHGVPRYSSRAEEVWLDPDVDAIYIATPPHLHAGQTIGALQAGKHVLCEKPMAMSEAEGRAMVAAAEANGRHLAIAHQMRFHHSYRMARDLAAGGLLGQVRVIQIEHLTSLPAWFGPDLTYSQYRFARAYGGGTIMDMGVHDFDGIRFILQREVVEVCALGGANSFPGDVDDTAVVAFQLPGPIWGTLALSFDVQGGGSVIRIHGSQGTLIVEQKAQEDHGRLCAWLDGAWHEYEVPHQNPYEAEIAHLVRTIGGQTDRLINGMEGLRSLRVTLACVQAMDENRPIRV